MKPEHHALVGGAISLSLLPLLGPLPSAGFLAGSILIDLDHYLDFVGHNRFRSFSFLKMLEYHKRLFPRIKRPDFYALELFHTVEFLGGFALFSLWSGRLLLQTVAAGMVVHFLCDLVYLKRIGAFSARAHSLIEYVIRKRRKVRRGLLLERPFQEALAEMGLCDPNAA